MWFADDEERRRALVDWGVPVELLDHTGFFELDGLVVPKLLLPADWTAGSWPPVELVVAAMNEEVSVWLPATPPEPIDLDWFGDSLSRTTGLACCSSEAFMRNLELLSKAENLRWLRGPAGDTEVDLSALTKLRSLDLRGFGLSSAIASPMLGSLAIDVAEPIPRDLIANSGIVELILTAPAFDTNAIVTHTPRLKYIAVADSPRVDVGPLAGLAALEGLKIMSCREVVGFAELQHSRSLEELVLYGIRRIDDPSSLLRIKAKRVEVTGCADIDESLAARASKINPKWYVKASRSKKGRTRFEVAATPHIGAVVTFTDWSWLTGLVAETHPRSTVGPYELEKLLAAVAADDPATSDVDVEYDTEAGGFVAVARTKREAQLLVRIWDDFLSRTDQLLSRFGEGSSRES